MAYLTEYDDVWPLFRNVLTRVMRYGAETSPRGQRTKEIRNVMMTLKDPTSCLLLGTGRKMSAPLAAAEALQLVGGFSDPDTTAAIAPRYQNYREDDGSFWGAYGPRTGDALEQAIDKLKRDPDTRQANVTIWRNELDNEPEKRDYPCTVYQGFAIRDGKLLTTTHMRSNDVWIGVPYDILQFTSLHRTIAAFLGVEAGAYTHVVDSMHLYERDFQAADDYLKSTRRTALPFLQGGIVPRGWDVEGLGEMQWSDVQVYARLIFAGEIDVDANAWSTEAVWMANTMSKWRAGDSGG